MVPRKAGFFLLGFVLWSILAGFWLLFVKMVDADIRLAVDIVVAIPGIAASLIVWLACERGWGWYPQSGGLKRFTMVLIGTSVVGAVFIWYWTGKGLVQMYHEVRTALAHPSEERDGSGL